MISLRDYQEGFVARIREAFARHRRVLAVSPTGSGKTACFAYITASATEKNKRTLVIAHRTEIVAQIGEALDGFGVRHGRIQPGHRHTNDRTQIAMIQTLARRLDMSDAPDLIIVDEAHHAISDSYQAILKRWPQAKILGVTATPQRLDGRGLGRMFDDMVLGPTPGELIKAGWLAPYDYLAPPSSVDLSKISTQAGDYATDELSEAIDKVVITGDAVQHYKDYIAPRSAIVFAVRIDHAGHVAEQFCASGISAASVDGTMDRVVRRDRIEGIGNGKYQVLTSCALISEGLDVPSVGGVILLRPTKSLALHLQTIGRALRPKADGSRATILDHVGNIHRHGLPDAPRRWSLDDKKRKSESAPVKQCEVCYRIFPAGPGWRDGQECPDGSPDGCVLVTPDPAERGIAEGPEQVDGQLIQVTTTPVWARGCDILTARGAEFKALMQHADTYEKMDQIRKVRGYHYGWTKHAWGNRSHEQA